MKKLRTYYMNFHNGIAKEVIKEDINMIEEQKTEVLLFLWLTAGVPFLYNCKNENFKNILDRNIYNILFERLKDNYDNEVFDAIYKSRRGIYNTMLKPNIPNMLFQDYLKIVTKPLWTKVHRFLNLTKVRCTEANVLTRG